MAKKRKFKYGVFDRDGVIIDTTSASIALFNELANETKMSFSLPAKDVFKKTMSSDWSDTLRKYLPVGSHQSIIDFNRLYDRRMREINTKAAIFPAIPTIINALKEQDFKLFISSFAPTDVVTSSLSRFGIQGYFDLALGFGDKVGGESKDDHLKEFAVYLKQEFPDFARAAFFIGDSPRDMIVAARNGVFGIGITTTHGEEDLRAAGADAVIDRHEDLLEIVKP